MDKICAVFKITRPAAIYNITAGIQKKILKGQGMIRFNVNDIFHSRRAPVVLERWLTCVNATTMEVLKRRK